MCGENTVSPLNISALAGSSPRVRGKLRGYAPRGRRKGLIPACAGKTARNVIDEMKRGAHPRVCGENKRPRRYEREPVGSSPRVRGKRRQVFESTRRRGLIPACAGKTPSQRQPPSKAWAHPRVCGENAGLSDVRLTVNGSSPRVRGKPRTSRRRPRGMGLIPACAGKTGSEGEDDDAAKAHPRVCGESSLGFFYVKVLAGSSPRVRGKHGFPAKHSGPRGLIPACAGKTQVVHQRLVRIRAHPRVCGEN